MSVENLFFLLGGTLFLGLLASYIFDKTSIPEVVILMSLGVLLGPILHVFPVKTLHAISPYVGTLALVVILFEGGLGIDFDQLPRQFFPALFLTSFTFVFTLLVLAGCAHLILGLPWLVSVLFGAILCSAPSIIIAIPLISRMKVSNEVQTVVKLESTFADVLSIVISVSLIRAISLGSQENIRVMPEVIQAFIIAVVIAIGAGLLWLKTLNVFKGHPLSYMMTFGVVLLLYSFVEFIGGSGGIAVLVFATVLANAEQFFSRWGLHEHFVSDSKIHGFHAEISFFIRTFFFVYLGMLFGIRNLTVQFVFVFVLIALLIIGIRFMSIKALGFSFESHKENQWIYFYMIPRGLATAVLAGLPEASHIPNTHNFLDYAFALILFTTIFMTVGILKRRQNLKDLPEPKLTPLPPL